MVIIMIPTYMDQNHSQPLQQVTTCANIVLYLMKSVWLLDRLENHNGFAWLPQKIRGIGTVILHV